MARDVDIQIPKKEEIVSYEYYRSGSVRVTVGFGDLDETGEFIQDYSHGTQLYDLVGDDFDSLMAASGDKPQGRFRVEDLWSAIDGKRVASKLEKVKEDKQIQEVSTNPTT